MKANELRIGNLLMYNSPVSLTSEMIELNIYHLSDILGETVLSCSDRKNAYEPIPISEEWLLNFGFDFQEPYHWFHNKIQPIFITKSFLESDTFLVKTTFGDKLTSLKFVHDLQNFYFSITGEELELTK